MMEKKCYKCSYWEIDKEQNNKESTAKCTFISGKRKLNIDEKDKYPDIEKTGIETTPLSYHDGIGMDYTTKGWFGCIHFNDKNNNKEFTYCQSKIEGEKKCTYQCDHCRKYYKDLEQQKEELKNCLFYVDHGNAAICLTHNQLAFNCIKNRKG